MNHQPGFYPGTDVLINLADIREQAKLQAFELAMTSMRLYELQRKPVAGSFDLEHLKSIHRYIFQDVYPFAGQIRTVDISKGGFPFANYRFLEQSAAEVFGGLKQEKFLVGQSLEQFAERAAYYKAEINVLHPFREGNGRTQREFIRQLAHNAGWELNWSAVNAQLLFEASVESTYNTRALADVIKQAVSPERWQRPLDMTVADLLKTARGLPVNQELSPNLLAAKVKSFHLGNSGDTENLKFVLDNDDSIQSFKLQKVPHLSQTTKNQWIDQLAAGMNSGLDRGRDLQR